MDETVVFDVDGTICFDGRSIDPQIAAELEALNARARLVFASARPIRDLLPVLPSTLHGCTLIGGNGAFTRHLGALDVLGIAHEDRIALDRLIDHHDLPVLIDGEWDYCYTGDQAHRIFAQLDAGRIAHNIPRDQLDTYSKVILFTSDPDVLAEVAATHLSYSVHPNEGTIDIAPSGITKHDALNRLGIADGSYVAFGNDANDVPMLAHAQTSYRVGDHSDLEFVDHTLTRDQVPQAIATLAR